MTLFTNILHKVNSLVELYFNKLLRQIRWLLTKLKALLDKDDRCLIKSLMPKSGKQAWFNIALIGG